MWWVLERLQVHFINQPTHQWPHHISSPQLRLVYQYDIRDRRSQLHPSRRPAHQTTARNWSLGHLRPPRPPNSHHLVQQPWTRPSCRATVGTYPNAIANSWSFAPALASPPKHRTPLRHTTAAIRSRNSRLKSPFEDRIETCSASVYKPPSASLQPHNGQPPTTNKAHQVSVLFKSFS